jgi:hypothetical protein
MISDARHSTVRGIELESPRPTEGETTVRVRRDTCINLSFDMQSLSGRTATYDGLKIPSTPSVRKHGSESGKNLLHLQIRVLGATTKAHMIHCVTNAKIGRGIRTLFPTFVLRAMYLFHKRTEEYSSLSPWPAIPSIASRVIQNIGE